MSQLLGQRVRVTADRDDVPLDGLWLGLEDCESIRRRGTDFGQHLFVLAESGQLADQTLDHLLDILPIRLPGNKQRMTSSLCLCICATNSETVLDAFTLMLDSRLGGRQLRDSTLL